MQLQSFVIEEKDILAVCKSPLVEFGFPNLRYYIYPKLKGHESR